MEIDYWYRQNQAKPLFPDIEWSKPENQLHAGKLVIIGGNEHGFKAPAIAYNEAINAGVGTTRVLLPDVLSKTVSQFFEGGEFAPSTPSGSFSQAALAASLDLSEWSDGVLLAGDLGKNSETAIILEKYIKDYQGQLTLVQDAIDYYVNDIYALKERPETTYVVNLSQIQHIMLTAHFGQTITSTMDLLHVVETLNKFTSQQKLNVIMHHQDYMVVASNGLISSTPIKDNDELLIKVAAHTAVWWIQNPTKTFEALTSAMLKL